MFSPLSVCLHVCLFVTCKMKDFSSQFCYSVCLVCLSIDSSQFYIDRHETLIIVQVVSNEKAIDFEIKGHFEVKFLKSSFFIWLTWKLNRICIQPPFILSPTSTTRGNRVQRSTTKLKFLKPPFSTHWLEIWRGVAHLVNEFNHQLFLRSNLFDVFCKYVLYTTSSSS